MKRLLVLFAIRQRKQPNPYWRMAPWTRAKQSVLNAMALKDPESFGIDRFLEYCTCVNMAWCSSLRQRWIYNYGWWCELNNPFPLPARPRITIGRDNKSHRMLSHIELVVSSSCCRFNCGNLRSSHLDHGCKWCRKKQRSKCLLWRTCGQHQPLPSLHAIDFVFPSDGTMPYPLVWHQGLWNSKHQWGRGRFC